MKDVVIYEGISTKFISYFFKFYFIWYEFSKFVNRKYKTWKIVSSSLAISSPGQSLKSNLTMRKIARKEIKIQ
jgi:hypothetical protein